VNSGSVVVARAFSTIFRIKIIYCIHLRMARRGPKHVVIRRDIIYINNKKLSVAIAGLYLKDSYVYVTQQDVPHKDKNHRVYELRSPSETLNTITTLRKLDLFPSSREERETSTLLCPLERANLKHSNQFRKLEEVYKPSDTECCTTS
jgi:hypothetical protein